MIIFDESSHTYTHQTTNERYISVTTLLSLYREEFDSDAHATRIAAKEGVSKEFILETWNNIKTTATDKGSKIHKILENYIKVGEVLPDYAWLYKTYEQTIRNTISNMVSVKSENLLYNEFYTIAGTADLIFDQGNYFTIGDFKTNKKFRFTSNFNEFLKSPVDHLTHCELNDYALQLSIYAYLHELNTGKKCKKLVIFYLKDDKIIPIHCNYLKSDVINLLNDYRLNKKAAIFP